MDVKSELERLYNSRLLKEDDDILIFESSINNLLGFQDSKVISGLCKCFDDNCEQREVMYGLVHAIESFEGIDYVEQIIISTKHMIKVAEGWAKTLYYGILNDELTFKNFIMALNNTEDIVNQEAVILLLNKIADEDKEMFGEKVDFIKKGIGD